MAEPPFGSTLLNVWEEYRRCAYQSRQAKVQLTRARVLALGLGIAGAVFGLLATQTSEPPALARGLAAASAVVLGLAAYLTKEALDAGLERQWVLARSLAEALKSEAFKFMAKVPPYDGADRDSLLSTKARDLLGDTVIGVPLQLTVEEKRKGLPSNWLDMEAYLTARVCEQLDNFYEPKAAENQRMVGRLRLAVQLLGGLGVVLGGLGAALEAAKWMAGWVAVMVTISGAIVAFLFAGRFQHLTQSYELTARRLRWLLDDWRRVPVAEQVTRSGGFVDDFEDVISIENKHWVAEWQKKHTRETEKKVTNTISDHKI